MAVLVQDVPKHGQAQRVLAHERPHERDEPHVRQAAHACDIVVALELRGAGGGRGVGAGARGFCWCGRREPASAWRALTSELRRRIASRAAAAARARDTRLPLTKFMRSSSTVWKNLENMSIANRPSTRRLSSSRNSVSAMHTSGMVKRSVSLTRSTSAVRRSPRKSALSAAASATMATSAWLHSTTMASLDVVR